MRRAQPAAAAAGSRFDHHRVADFLCDFDRVALGLDDSLTSRRHWNTGFAREHASSVFVAHRLHRARRRPDKLDVAAFTDFREVRVLRKKSITGMNRVDVANLGCAHDAIDF